MLEMNFKSPADWTRVPVKALERLTGACGAALIGCLQVLIPSRGDHQEITGCPPSALELFTRN